MLLPKAIIFDVGGTLISNNNFSFERGLKYLYNDVFIVNSSYEEYLISLDKVLKKIKSRDITNLEISFSSLFNYLQLRYELKTNKTLDEIEQTFSHIIYDASLIDNVKELLTYLKSKDVKMYVLSNSMFSTKVIKNDLTSFNILSYFDYVISTGDHLFRKPDELIFDAYLMKLKALNILPKEVMYIGNEYAKDIVTPLNLGMKAVLYSNKLIKHPTYLEIDNYLNLIKEFTNE